LAQSGFGACAQEHSFPNAPKLLLRAFRFEPCGVDQVGQVPAVAKPWGLKVQTADAPFRVGSAPTGSDLYADYPARSGRSSYLR
jgi:hypothetical protein